MRISLIREGLMRWRLIVPHSPEADRVMERRQFNGSGKGKAMEWRDKAGQTWWMEYFYQGADALNVLQGVTNVR